MLDYWPGQIVVFVWDSVPSELHVLEIGSLDIVNAPLAASVSDSLLLLWLLFNWMQARNFIEISFAIYRTLIDFTTTTRSAPPLPFAHKPDQICRGTAVVASSSIKR